jgi:hypothetical protein
MALKNTVILNGFKESRAYVESLQDIIYVGEIKTEDGYDTIDCYEQTED